MSNESKVLIGNVTRQKVKKSISNVVNNTEMKDKAFRIGGQVLSGRTQSVKLQKFVQYAAAKEYEDGNIAEALALYESIPERIRTDEVWVRIAKIYGQTGEPARGIALLENLQGKGLSNKEVEWELKRVKDGLVQQKHDDDLRRSFEDEKYGMSFSFVDKAFGNSKFRTLESEVIRNTKDYLELFELRKTGEARFVTNLAGKLASGDPEDSVARYELAVALYESGQLYRALQELGNIDKTRFAESMLELMTNLQQAISEKLVIAEYDLSKLLVSNNLLFEETRPERFDGQTNKPLDSWGRLELLNSIPAPSPTIKRLILDELITTGRFKMARERLEECFESGTITENEALELAKCELVLDGAIEAETFAELNRLRKLSKLKPYSWAEVYSKLGAKDQALRMLSEEKQFSPMDSWWWDQFSRLSIMNGNPDDACASAVMAAEIDQSAKRHFRAGIVAEQNQQFGLAVEQYAAAIGNKFEKSVARLHLGLTFWKLTGDACTALRILEPFWKEFDFNSDLEMLLAPEKDLGSVIAESEETVVPNTLIDEVLAKTQTGEFRQSLSQQVKSIFSSKGLSGEATLKVNSAMFKAALRELRSGNVEEAQRTLWKLAFMMGKHDSSVFYALAYCSAISGEYERAMKLFVISEELPTPFLYEVGNPSTRARNVYRYLELREILEVFPNLWLWESHFGRRVDCNPLAIYQQVQLRGFENHLHVWVANEGTDIPAEVAESANTVICRRESAGYWLALACAKFLCNNGSFSFEYMHRDGQVSVNTWHGTPLKYLGRDDKDSPYDYGNVGRNLIHSTQVLMPNDFTAEIMTRHYEVDRLISGAVTTTGYPRNDVLANISESERKNLRRRIGASLDKPVVLYAPTWRGSSKVQKVDSEKLLADLRLLGSQDDFQLIFRGHPLSQELLKDFEIPVLVPAPELSTYELIAAADIVVTDYSSLGIDALVGEAPVVYYVYDFDEYRSDRGLYFSKNEFPGPTFEDVNSLLQGIGRLLSDRDLEASYSAFKQKFVPMDDGSASSRCLDLMLHDDGIIRTKKQVKKSVLIHNTFTSVKECEILRQALECIDPEKWDVSVCFDHSTIEIDPALSEFLDTLPRHIRVIPRKGALVAKAEEHVAVSSLYSAWWVPLNLHLTNLYRSALERENFRLFGKNSFDLAIKWGPDSTFWTGFFALGVNADTTVFVNTISQELQDFELHPALRRSTQFLSYFDRLEEVSVSSGTELLESEESLDSLLDLDALFELWSGNGSE